MRNDFWRVVATIAVWILLAGVSITALVASGSAGSNIDITAVALVPLIMGFFVTIPIWHGSGSSDDATVTTSSEKAKRGASDPDAKLRLLYELMDDDEREAFKATLKQRVLDDMTYDDGELATDAETLESLLDESVSRQYRR